MLVTEPVEEKLARRGISSAGGLYVADLLNHRISVFGANGTFTRAFGWDVADTDGNAAFEVCPGQGACRAGDPGGGAGQLGFPSGIALDGAGGLYVADSLNHRISVFGTAGPSFTRAFGWDVADPDGNAALEVCPAQGTCRAGDSGGGGGQLGLPSGIALDGAGGLYVADSVNNRISVFGTAGPSFTRAFGWDVASPNDGSGFEVCPTQGACLPGDFGGGGGQLEGARGVALDGAGGLYVAELNNNRISVFGTAGPSFTHAFGWDVADPDGDAAFEVCPAQGACRVGDGDAGAGAFTSPVGVATDCRGAAWVTDAGNDRLQRFGEAGKALPPCLAVAPPPVVTPPAAAPATVPGQPPQQRSAAVRRKGTACCRGDDGHYWARTSDLRLVEAALSQLS